jgi:predicted aspartyl protease
MAYEKGKVNEYLEPSVWVEFEIGKKLEFVIDTGFGGSLCLPRHLMNDLGLVKDLEEEIYGIGLHTEILDISVSEIYWFGETKIVNILINDGDDRLIGSQLLNDKILTINYQDKTVTISN